MPEEQEVETTDLQEAIDELHRDRTEREEQERQTVWTRYISLTTALLAVFAAVGSLQAGSKVNEAMMSQIKASDSWNQYQASRQKTHLYTVETNAIVDGAFSYSPVSKVKGDKKWSPKSREDRAKDYEAQVAKEETTSKKSSEKASDYEKEAKLLMEAHESFARSVALIQVAIALGAISALTKIKPVWFMSILVGAAGIIAFGIGFSIK